jgi:hypothetical protein
MMRVKHSLIPTLSTGWQEDTSFQRRNVTFPSIHSSVRSYCLFAGTDFSIYEDDSARADVLVLLSIAA